MAMKRWPLLLFFSVLVLIVSTQVFRSDSAIPDGAIEIEFWTMQLSPVLDEYITSSIAEFEAEHPGIRVKWVDVAWADMERKLLSSVAGRTAPDIANLNPQFSSKLAEFGALTNPAGFLHPDEISQYNLSVWNSNQLNGRHFGVPWYLSTSVAIYNRSILEAAEVSFPGSLEDIPHIGRQIKRSTGKYTYFPSFDGGEPMENYVLLGGNIGSGVQGHGLDQSSLERFFNYYAALYESGAVPPSVLVEGHQKAIDLFQSGELAMLLSGMQMLRSIELNAPELMSDIIVRPQPAASRGETNIAAMNLVVPEQSPHPDAAFRFISFMTSPAKQTEMAKLVPILPSTPESFEDPFFGVSDPNDRFQEARAISIQQIQNGRVLLPPLRNYSRLRTSFILKTQTVMIGDSTPLESANLLVKEWANISGDARD